MRKLILLGVILALGLSAAPAVEAQAPTGKVKVVKAKEYRKPLAIKNKVKGGKTHVLAQAGVEATLPNGWAAKSHGKDVAVGPGGKPAKSGAIVVAKRTAKPIQLKAPVGIVLEELARELIKQADSFRPGLSKLKWEISEHPMAFRADGGRYGRMVARAKSASGETVEGYISLYQKGNTLYVVAGQWDQAKSKEFQSAADTLLSSMKVKK